MDLSSLYEDIQLPHGLTTRLRLETLRSNFEPDYAARFGGEIASDTERTPCTETIPCAGSRGRQ